MLTIQPNFTRNYSVRPAFGWSESTIEEEKQFYQDRVDEIDGLLENNFVPESIKKPFKFFRVLGNAAFQGLAVFGSTLAVAEFLKKGKAKLSSYKFVQKSVDKFKNLKLGEKFNNVYLAAKNTNLGKKVSEYIDKFDKSELGLKVADLKTKSKDTIKKVVTPLKKVNYKNATAVVLGTGSGLAGGYEEFIKENPVTEETA